MQQADEDEMKPEGHFTRAERGPDISGMPQRSRGTLDLLFCSSDLCVVYLFRIKYHQQLCVRLGYLCILALVAKRSEHSDSLRWAANGERFRNICSDVSAPTMPFLVRIRGSPDTHQRLGIPT